MQEELEDITDDIDIADLLPIERVRRSKQIEVLEWEDWDSAYEIAVDNWFIGSERERLDSLVWKDWKDGVDGRDWIDWKDWKKWKDGKDGRDWKHWVDWKDGKDWKDGVDGKDWSLDSGEDIVNKINDLPVDDDSKKIDAKHIKNLPKSEAMGMWSRYASNGIPEWWSLWQKLVKKSHNDYDTQWIDDAWWGWVTDHWALTWLADDDHPQYHNDARGDVRYYTKSVIDTQMSGKSNVWHWHSLSEIGIDANLEMGSFNINTQTASYFAALSWASSSYSIDNDVDDIIPETMSVMLMPRSPWWFYVNGVTPIPTMTGTDWVHLWLYNDYDSGNTVIIPHKALSSAYYFINPSWQDITLQPWEGIHYQYREGKWWVCSDQYSAAAWGVDTEIQYRDNGVFWGASRSKIDAASWTIQLVAWSDPTTPAAGNLLLYSKNIAGKVIPKVKWPSGLDYPLQESFRQNSVCMWSATTATNGVWFGTAGIGVGTYSTALPTTTNLYTCVKRARWANVITTANQVLGLRNTESLWFRGNKPWMWWFFFAARCGMDVRTNGGRFFGGFHTATTVVTADPSSVNNTVGFCVDAADNGAISFLTRGTVATKAATGMTFTSSTWYDLYIFAAPNSSSISWRIVKINDGTEASGVATINLPSATQTLTAWVLASNAALVPATSIQIWLNRIYVSSDY